MFSTVLQCHGDPCDARIAELAALVAASEATRLAADEELAPIEPARLSAEAELDALRQVLII